MLQPDRTLTLHTRARMRLWVTFCRMSADSRLLVRHNAYLQRYRTRTQADRSFGIEKIETLLTLFAQRAH